MNSVIERMEQELAYLESASSEERDAWEKAQTFEYDPIWDDIFEFECNAISECVNFVVLCESYNTKTSMSGHKLNNMPKSENRTLIVQMPCGCVFDAIAEAA